MIDPDHPLAHHLDRRHGVRHEQDRPTGITKRQHLADRTILKGDVANRQDLADHQHFSLDLARHPKSEAPAHARPSPPHRVTAERPQIANFHYTSTPSKPSQP